MEKHTLHLRDERGREVATVSPASALRETSLRSASLLSAAGETVVAAKDKAFLFTLIPILALLCNYGRGSCLSYVGTEGANHFCSSPTRPTTASQAAGSSVLHPVGWGWQAGTSCSHQRGNGTFCPEWPIMFGVPSTNRPSGLDQ